MDIFLVEDSSAIRRLLAARLDLMPGARVIGEAEGAPQAIALIDWLQPQTVLLDMNLAVGTGLDVLRELRGRGYKGRILMLSQQSAELYKDLCIKAGADGFYDKGTGLETLFNDLEELLQSEAATGRQTRMSPLLRDTVTGLLGQVALLERLDQVLRVLRGEAQPVVVAVVVLRGLQALLLSHGPAATAPMLVELGQRLKACTGESDLLARHADEQFALVVSRVATAADAEALSQRLDEALSQPFQLAGRPLLLHCSVGVAVYPRDAISARGLLNLAECRAHGESLPSDGSAVVH
ncbi:diguanylate cyclase domain-containing protein [Roseateles depolymerans]|uniref:Putative transcriptional regulator n=1 Tax=Roseateles depolymerans TaxID=76731 RepID=A0A0U3N8U2_9BURK|nr:diguanylate cyclase [Roseateles depolymerans]ALV08571.1 Putative transcriptional regulator [Roseateles depolymerans]REG21203.1 GGDEF domain-containing protein [Roseateles depolymerans]